MRSEARGPFAFDLARSILADHDVGIFNGRLTAGTPPGDAFAVAGLFAPPYASPDFLLDVRVRGERVTASGAWWQPRQVDRRGACAGIEVATTTILTDGYRAGLVHAVLENRSSTTATMPLMLSIRGFLDATTAWEFQRPRVERPTSCEVVPQGLVLANDAGAVEVQADLAGCRWDAITRTARAELTLAPGASDSFTITFAIGDRASCRVACDSILADPAGAMDRARGAAARDEAGLSERLPRLSASDPRLEGFFRRSLASLSLHRWNVPEFLLHPYYGVGSIGGGVVGCYLWDYSIPWQVLPLYDPEAARSHILQFLATGIDDAYGFNPMTGAKFGTWYAVNPEKMVWLVRHYVALTGDAGLLDERIDGRTVLDQVLACALFGDDPSTGVGLVDYREEKFHLELRRGFPYDNFVPDLNGRRYGAYLAASELASLAGRPDPRLADRARALKRALRELVWDPEARWFRFIDARGVSGMRYTNEMFELIGSGVLDPDQEAGLVGHLNDREFLSEFGMHSISKLDPAYDPVDIDHGGGGCFVGIAPGIVERLYRAGYAAAADDLLGRILWWGERMPYWGDSLCADRIDYRRDTPYTCALPAAAGAQAIVFGLFGVSVGLDGAVRVDPRPPSFCPRIALRGVRIRDIEFDVEAGPDGYVVRSGGKTRSASIGEPREVVAPGRPTG
jgi:hypothetical protein